ncbi:DUF3800 domain-containing protein [Nocardia arizonensis]|uniref:DUF3800 domain-containing protein n=2 Tax=Nocardia arizonensis TaxID=1141647 RepID=UPI0012E9236E
MAAGSRVWAYVDETGDRGSGPSASPVFGMAAVLVDDLGAVELRRAVQQLRTEFKVPANKVMSWKDVNPLEVWRLLYAASSRDRAAAEAARTAAMWVS